MIKGDLKLFIITLIIAFISANVELNAYNSLSEYDTVVQNQGWVGRNITSSGLSSKLTINYGNFLNTCFPTNLDDEDSEFCNNNNRTQAENILINAGIGIAPAAVVATLAVISGPIGFVAGVISMIPLVTTGSSFHVVRPDEYFNLLVMNQLTYGKCVDAENNKNPYDCNYMIRCKSQQCDMDNIYTFHKKNSDSIEPLTPQEIPFFFHCDPMWDPVKSSGSGGEIDDMEKFGKTWGYTPEFCDSWPYDKQFKGFANSENVYDLKYAGQNITQRIKDSNLIGTIVVAYDNVFANPFYTPEPGYDKLKTIELRAGEAQWVDVVYYIYAYYKYDSDDGKYKLCAANLFSLIPVEIGCTYIPPPKGLPVAVSYFDDYIKDTRCVYLKGARNDLKGLAIDVLGMESESAATGGPEIGMRRFLLGDMHAISTSYGCIQDLLTNFFAKPGNSDFSTFQSIQDNFKSIVMVILTLYLVVVGIKLISSPQPVKISEAVMMVLKFSLVAYFALGDAWYNFQGSGIGIYHALMEGGTYIASFFTEGLMANDPLGFCSYTFNNSDGSTGQLLRNRLIPSSSAVTEGFNGVKLTMMDLLDCKLATYFNFGSCNFSAMRLTIIWLIGLIFFASIGSLFFIILSGVMLLLFMSLLVYCILMLMIAFKYVYISISALFVITILIFLSPILVLFALFESTKQIFDSYFKMLIGYMLYPALLFAFISLMLATLDSVYYGISVDNVNTGDPEVLSNEVVQKCEELEQNQGSSLFCLMVQNKKSFTHPCVANKSTELFDLFSFHRGSWEVLGVEIAHFYSLASPEKYLKEVAKLALFAFLFYLFMQSINEFLSIMVSVRELGGDSLGGMLSPNLLTMSRGSFMGVSKQPVARAVRTASAETAKVAVKGVSALAKAPGKIRASFKNDDSNQRRN